MKPTTWRGRLAGDLAAEVATSIDNGLGQLAMAALLATPRGPARAVEAARWARLAAESVDRVVVIIRPGEGSTDFIDAHAELMVALANERESGDATGGE